MLGVDDVKLLLGVDDAEIKEYKLKPTMKCCRYGWIFYEQWVQSGKNVTALTWHKLTIINIFDRDNKIETETDKVKTINCDCK